MEHGEFHWQDGIFFRRLADGSVNIRTEEDNSSIVIPPNEWCSIIAHVASDNGSAEAYSAAERLHLDK